MLSVVSDLVQARKAPLVEEGCSLWHLELSTEAKAAFTEIFRAYAPLGYMDTRDLSLYLDKSNPAANKLSSTHARTILLRFGSGSDSRLTLDNFLSYYAESAFMSPKDVWQHLHTHGYGTDLQKGATRAVDQRLPEEPLELPPISEQCLRMQDLYDTPAMELAEGAVTAIAKRASFKNELSSRQVMRFEQFHQM